MSSHVSKFSKALQYIDSTETQRANWPNKNEKEAFASVVGNDKLNAYEGQIAINKKAIELRNTEVLNQQGFLDVSNDILTGLTEKAIFCESEKAEMEVDFNEIQKKYSAMKTEMNLKLEDLQRAQANVEEQHARVKDAERSLDSKKEAYNELLISIDDKFGWFGAGTDHDRYVKKGGVNADGKKVFLSSVTANEFFDIVDPNEGTIEDVIMTKWNSDQQTMFRRLLLNCGWEQNPLFKEKNIGKLRMSQRRGQSGQNCHSFEKETLSYLPERSSSNKLTSSAVASLINASPLPSPGKRRYSYDEIVSDEDREKVYKRLDLPMTPVGKRRRMQNEPSTTLHTVSEENEAMKGPLIPTPDYKHN